MVADNNAKESPTERRRDARTVEAGSTAELSWEDKVLRRVGGHVARLAKTARQSQSSSKEMGWEAAGFEVLKNHANLIEDGSAE